MAIFLDTGEIVEIERFYQMGVIRGVTTNPSILRRDGLVDGIHNLEIKSKEIAKLIRPLPLSVEVITGNHAELISQAQALASWADNIIVKVPIHGPRGEQEYLGIIHELETKLNIRCNVTAMVNAQQCLLAALAGASYVSIFGGRINDMGYNSCSEISKLRKVLDKIGLKTQIIVGSSREVMNILEWLEAGAHIVTVAPQLLERMIVHPCSKEIVEMFLRDANWLEER